MPDELLLRGARVVSPEREEAECDILLKAGRIEAVAPRIEAECPVFDARGLCASPGLVDMHVHLRDPGQTQKEDIETGCRAAAAGGITSLAAMPNTSPAADCAQVLRYELARGARTGLHVYPVAAVTKGQKGAELCDFAALKKAGAVAFSDDGHPVAEAAVMLAAMQAAKSLGVPVISHCEEPSLAGGKVNEGAVSRALGVRGMPAAAEAAQAAREVALSACTGLPVHIAHVSAMETVEIVRCAKRHGVPVTAETCPHYFSLDESLVLRRDADYRMNPPLRAPRDVEAVREALRDGTLDCIVTDHAPHTAAEKADFETAPNGVVGLETSLAAGITFLVRPGVLTLRELIGMMSAAPARLLHLDAGTLAPGAPADLTLFDPQERWTVDPARLHSKSHNTAFKGMELYGRVHLTVASGRVVFRG